LREIGKGQRGVHPEIWARWAEIVGQDLARRSVPRSFAKGVLVVAVVNSSWMQQLTYLKPTLMDRFADEIGRNVVKEIRLVVDHSILQNHRQQ
jgi:predicted nucleic acid-binding Zn ribbon protein